MKSRINKIEYTIDKIEGLSFLKNNELHRDGDLPALILKTGAKFWYKNGLEHRDNDNPSEVYSNGDLSWWENGKHIKSVKKK